MRHVALYCRISQDKNGRAEGVEAQERQGREYAASAWPGVPVVAYVDNDVSSTNGDRRRAYESLVEAIERGDVAHLWAPEQSRLERDEVAWFTLRARLVAAGLTELHTKREGVVRVGELVSGIKAVINAEEIRTMKKRINDRLDNIAGAGLPPGSRPFGYEHGRNEDGDRTYIMVPEQADAIRWAAVQVLAGWSLSSVAAELRKRGLDGPHRVKVRDSEGEPVTDDQGNPVTRPSVITAISVRSMLTSPAIAGKRVHKGVIVGDGNWPAILSEDVWQSCKAKLSAPRRVERADGGNYPIGAAHSGYKGRKYLLTGGLAVCGICHAPLVGSIKQLQYAGRLKSSRAYLICHPKTKRPDGEPAGACVGIMLNEVEQHVVDCLFAELDKPEFLDALVVDEHAARRSEIIDALSAMDGQRKELAELWAGNDLTAQEWTAARSVLAERERALRAELAAKPPPPAVVDIARVRAAWPVLDLGEQREFIRLFIDRVTINRAVPGRKGFDDTRVVIDWRSAIR